MAASSSHQESNKSNSIRFCLRQLRKTKMSSLVFNFEKLKRFVRFCERLVLYSSVQFNLYMRTYTTLNLNQSNLNFHFQSNDKITSTILSIRLVFEIFSRDHPWISDIGPKNSNEGLNILIRNSFTFSNHRCFIFIYILEFSDTSNILIRYIHGIKMPD